MPVQIQITATHAARVLGCSLERLEEIALENGWPSYTDTVRGVSVTKYMRYQVYALADEIEKNKYVRTAETDALDNYISSMTGGLYAA